MRRFISLILAATLWLPGTIQAASPDCSKVPSLSTPGKEYVVGSVRVPVGCSLKLRAGVVVQFRNGASFTIQGKLDVEGERGNPVILKGVPGASWKGVMGDLSSDVSIVGLRVQDSEGMQLTEPPTVFRDVHMLDNVRNVVSIGTSHFVYEKRYTFQAIWFENRLLADNMLESGLTFYGQNHNLQVDGAHFQGVRRSWGFVKSLGKTASVGYNNITFSGCDSQVVNRYQLEYSIVPKASCLETSLPVLFVPGYGTSLNLSKMVSPPVPGQVVQGLHFVNALTPGYSVYLKSLRDNGVSYEVAYYDWRQPLEHNLKYYLLPALNRLKRKSGSRYVNVVAHSYGGILSRAYIQGNSYLGDVHKLVQVGTPNQGAIKAYPIWQAGELPDDWAAVGSLLRLYGKDIPESVSKNHDAIHRYFSSIQDLQPLYPSLKRGKNYLDGASLQYTNTRVLALNSDVSQLLRRATVATVVSDSEVTPSLAQVGTPSGQGIWPDGQVQGSLTGLVLGGDGTVPKQSAVLAGATQLKVEGAHQNLPGTSAEAIFTFLSEKPPREQIIPEKKYKKVTLFSIDCPVHVVVTGPNNYRVSTSDNLVDPLTGEGSVVATPDLQWFILPELDEGQYEVEIKALADTPVRYWQDMDEMHEMYLKEGEVQKVVLTRTLEGLSPPTESAPPQLEARSEVTQGTFESLKFTFLPKAERLLWNWEYPPTSNQTGIVLEHQVLREKSLRKEVLQLNRDRLNLALRVISYMHPIWGLTLQYLLQRE